MLLHPKLDVEANGVRSTWTLAPSSSILPLSLCFVPYGSLSETAS